MSKIRYTLEMNADVAQTVDSLVTRGGHRNKAEMFHSAIGVYDKLVAEVAAGSTVAVERADGSRVELVFSSLGC